MANVKVLKVVDRDHCIGCFSCMYACSRVLRRHGGTNKAALRIRHYAGLEGAFSLRVCSRCETPDCVESCPKEALFTARGGGVRLKAALCIHCRKCVRACGISALQWDENEKLPIPCIQCGQCVKYCPNGVLALVERPIMETADAQSDALSGETEKNTAAEVRA
jgi:Fe-S-cluster-containing dehydrogenase component